MNNKKYLGNIELIDPIYSSGKINVLQEKNYGFFHVSMEAGETLNFNLLSNYNVICLNTGEGGVKLESSCTIYLGPGDSIYSNRNNMIFESLYSGATLLVAGVKENSCENTSFEVVRVAAP